MRGSNSHELSGDDLQRFTATGRPYKPHDSSRSSGVAMMTAESFGQGAPNLLPKQYTDESIISVPVLPATDADADNASQVFSEADTLYDEADVKRQKKSRCFSTFIRRISSSKPKQPEFVMRDMPRGEYLKHYAKDSDGRYCGTEDPAPDCILNHEDDKTKYRGALVYQNDILDGKFNSQSSSATKAKNSVWEKNMYQNCLGNSVTFS